MTDTRTDAELLIAAREDAGAFRVLYDRWAPPLLAHAYRRTLDAEVAADIVAETFAIAWRKRQGFRDRGTPASSWLFGIATNELRRHHRRDASRVRALQRLGAQRPSLTSEDVERIEALVDTEQIRSLVVEALGRLPDKQQQALRLRVVEDLDYREVATRLGCTEGAARVRVHRALTRLGDLVEVPA